MNAPLAGIAVAAADALAPLRRPARALGQVGLPAIPAFCASDCLCADVDQLVWSLTEGSASGDQPGSLTLSVEPRRVSLLHGTNDALPPLTHEIVACSDLPRRTCRISRTGLFAVSTGAGGSQAAARALLHWLAVERLPPWPSSCSSRAAGAAAVGLAARVAWAAALRSDGLTGARLAVARTRLECWIQATRAGVAFLADVAGVRREPWRVRLRYAADWLSGEVDECLLPMADLLARRGGAATARAVAEQVDRATGMHARFVECLTAGVVRLLELPGASGQALESDWREPLSPMGRSELVYLCRAGARPLRVLAALRLMDEEHPSAEAALRQMLYSHWWPQVVAASVAMARRGLVASHALAAAGLAAAQQGPAGLIDRSVILMGAFCELNAPQETLRICGEALPDESAAKAYVEGRLAAGSAPRSGAGPAGSGRRGSPASRAPGAR